VAAIKHQLVDASRRRTAQNIKNSMTAMKRNPRDTTTATTKPATTRSAFGDLK